MEVPSKTMLAGLIGSGLIAASLFLPFENVTLHAYYDPPHIATDCAGHTEGVTIDSKPTPADCALFLHEDIFKKEAAVDRLVKVKLSPKTKAAFISFTFNVGEGKFARSTMLRKLNSKDIRGACMELAKCEKKDGKETGWGCGFSGGKKLNGLIARRAAEQKLCLEGI